MFKIIVINKIGEKIQDYQNELGKTKSEIAKEIGYSKQALEGIINSQNPTIKTLIFFSYFLKCNINDLYEIKIIE